MSQKYLSQVKLFQHVREANPKKFLRLKNFFKLKMFSQQWDLLLRNVIILLTD